MAKRQEWQNNWILFEADNGSKVTVDAIRFSDVRTIQADSKLSNGKMKRTFVLLLKDGAAYTIPDEAVTTSAPTEYTELIESISQSIKV